MTIAEQLQVEFLHQCKLPNGSSSASVPIPTLHAGTGPGWHHLKLWSVTPYQLTKQLLKYIPLHWYGQSGAHISLDQWLQWFNFPLGLAEIFLFFSFLHCTIDLFPDHFWNVQGRSVRHHRSHVQEITLQYFQNSLVFICCPSSSLFFFFTSCQ